MEPLLGSKATMNAVANLLVPLLECLPCLDVDSTLAEESHVARASALLTPRLGPLRRVHLDFSRAATSNTLSRYMSMPALNARSEDNGYVNITSGPRIMHCRTCTRSCRRSLALALLVR